MKFTSEPNSLPVAAPKQLPRIGLADDDLYFSQYLGDLLCKKGAGVLSFCARDGQDLLHQLAVNKTDVLLIDLYMPFISGMEAIQFIRKENSQISIVAYSTTYQPDIARTLKKLNTWYLSNQDLQAMLNLIYHITLKTPFDYPAQLAQWKEQNNMFIPSTDKLQKNHAELKPIELQLLILTAKGYTNKEIAQFLHLSSRTIDSYVIRLTEKLGLANKVALAYYAFTNGICKLDCTLGKKGDCMKESIFTSKNTERK